MQFLVGNELDEAIRRIAKEPGSSHAVAFIGNRASEEVFSRDSPPDKVVCNLASGGTNPHEIEALCQITDVRQCDTLHAKVYIGQQQAIVASANASANGLGFEGSEQSRWIEAGVLLEKTEEISSWFARIWKEGREISQADLDRAMARWNYRQKWRPGVISFEDYLGKSDEWPLISWVGGSEWEAEEGSLSEQWGQCDKQVLDAIEYGMEADHPDDQELLKERGWVLCFDATNKGKVKKRPNLGWSECVRVFKNAYRYEISRDKLEEDTHDCVTPVPGAHRIGPFDLKEPDFVAAFIEVMGQGKYQRLKEDDEEGAEGGPWFVPRVRLMEEFWRELKAEYLKRKRTE